MVIKTINKNDVFLDIKKGLKTAQIYFIFNRFKKSRNVDKRKAQNILKFLVLYLTKETSLKL